MSAIELRGVAKHFGIAIPRTVKTKEAIADLIRNTFHENPSLLKSPIIEESIDWKNVEQLCGMLCTYSEIAAFFHITVERIARLCYEEFGIQWSDFYAKYSSNGKISLRRAQMQSAVGAKAVYDVNGNRVREEVKPAVAMQIFLGKTILGQIEPREKRDDQSGTSLTMEDLVEYMSETKTSEDILTNPSTAKAKRSAYKGNG